ncbi:reverse transcriptase-like protein [Neobacillus sp. MM2021_6]|uniref:RNase H family protein n=1 Tax=Bacillaceae TaxID=186817 RepID=UPI00140E1AE4|nr:MULTISPECIES: RNase H family protein [Bacillaceae]MBO0958229.1 reverse transcriptase-like protein [Neobacillus sp. MM2021_6]NHC17828.1 reverse transcriptase-like protein [Bacillus sp. MM2020_4]
MIEVFIDGASAGNPGQSGAGVFIKANGKSEKYSIPLGNMTNHEAEFHAFIEALKICLTKGLIHSVVSFRTDSQLVNTSVEKAFVKNKLYAPLLKEALDLTKEIDLFFMKWIPSSENKVADELARLAIQKNSSKESNKLL